MNFVELIRVLKSSDKTITINDLDCNQLNAGEIEAISAALAANKTMTNMVITGSRLSSGFTDAILTDSIVSTLKIQTSSLDEKAFGRALEKNEELVSLELDCSQINKLENIAQGLPDNHTLKKLRCTDCDGSSRAPIWPIAKNDRLTEINFEFATDVRSSLASYHAGSSPRELLSQIQARNVKLSGAIELLEKQPDKISYDKFNTQTIRTVKDAFTSMAEAYQHISSQRSTFFPKVPELRNEILFHSIRYCWSAMDFSLGDDARIQKYNDQLMQLAEQSLSQIVPTSHYYAKACLLLGDHYYDMYQMNRNQGDDASESFKQKALQYYAVCIRADFGDEREKRNLQMNLQYLKNSEDENLVMPTTVPVQDNVAQFDMENWLSRIDEATKIVVSVAECHKPQLGQQLRERHQQVKQQEQPSTSTARPRLGGDGED